MDLPVESLKGWREPGMQLCSSSYDSRQARCVSWEVLQLALWVECLGRAYQGTWRARLLDCSSAVMFFKGLRCCVTLYLPRFRWCYGAS